MKSIRFNILWILELNLYFNHWSHNIAPGVSWVCHWPLCGCASIKRRSFMLFDGFWIKMERTFLFHFLFCPSPFDIKQKKTQFLWNFLFFSFFFQLVLYLIIVITNFLSFSFFLCFYLRENIFLLCYEMKKQKMGNHNFHGFSLNVNME